MTEASAEKPSRVLPFHDPSRRRRLSQGGGRGCSAPPLPSCSSTSLGIDVIGWLQDLWEQIKAVPAGYIVAALVSQTGQTVFAGLSYYGILSAAYPGEVSLAPIVTAYAVGVAMNNFLPANIGTFVTLLMFVAIIPACTFAGALAAYLVQKIFFTIAGTFVYLYLFLSVPGSFDENLGNLTDHPVVAVAIAVGVVLSARPPRPHLLAPGEEALGPGEEGRASSSPSRSATSPTLSCPPSCRGSASWS